VARTAGLIAVAVLGIVMLQVFKSELDRHVSELRLPSSTVSSLRAQSNKLAGIAVPESRGREAEQAIRRSIDESFISGFRMLMTIGAVLAVASATTALVLVRGPDV
jgi:hypothetical protein